MNRDEVKNLLGLNKVYFEAFYNVCPFTLSTLKSKQKYEPLIFYKHLGAFWVWLSGETLERTGFYFNKNHSTVIHSLTNIINEKDHTYKEYLKNIINENENLIQSDRIVMKEIMGDNYDKKQTYLINKVNILEQRLENIQDDLTTIKTEI
jgi:hypothetical protein